MRSQEKSPFLLPKEFAHLAVAYLVKRYNEVSRHDLGRIILQKLCYFSEANGIPLPFRFEIYHYGPFCEEIYDVTDNLLVDDVIKDEANGDAKSKYIPGPNFDALLAGAEDNRLFQKYRRALEDVVETFSELDPTQMEMISTIHYAHSSYSEWNGKPPSKEQVVRTVLEIKKEKFPEQSIGRVYDILRDAGLLK
jgi:uncharacterized protein YwgA